MTVPRDELERKVESILQRVFGVGPGELAADRSFAEDLMAESLDYLDIGLHITQTLGIPFDFGEAVDEMRAAGAGPIRIRDLVDYLERRLADA